jgi:hypothetical protein
MSLAPNEIEAIAQRVAELIEGPKSSMGKPRLGTAKELADALGVERKWVYANQERLRVIRLGQGPRARLRFDLERAAEGLAAVEDSGQRRRVRRRKKAARSLPAGVDLIRGRSGE